LILAEVGNLARNGDNSFPKYYGAADPSVKTKLEEVCGKPADDKQYWEFPLFRDAHVYNGGDPAKYRVIAIGKKEDSPQSGYTYCLSIYHPDDAQNGFLPCQVVKPK
jgi:hypothetical protein